MTGATNTPQQPQPRQGFDKWWIYWLAWGAMFFAIEIPAAMNRTKGDTLSEKVWDILGTPNSQDPLPRWIQVRRIGFLSFWAWLTVHFLRRGWV